MTSTVLKHEIEEQLPTEDSTLDLGNYGRSEYNVNGLKVKIVDVDGDRVRDDAYGHTNINGDRATVSIPKMNAKRRLGGIYKSIVEMVRGVFLSHELGVEVMRRPRNSKEDAIYEAQRIDETGDEKASYVHGILSGHTNFSRMISQYSTYMRKHCSRIMEKYAALREPTEVVLGLQPAYARVR